MSHSEPYWRDYRDWLQALVPEGFAANGVPASEALNHRLASRIAEHGGRVMRFVPAGQLPAVAYEDHIFRTGEISTRENNWHDFFNALAWARFPRTKLALNAAHIAQIGKGHEAHRGPVRDALTLFDECGVVVISNYAQALQALAQRDWQRLFCELRSTWPSRLRVFVPGHALLEKFLNPYKAMTAHALVLQASPEFLQLDDERQASQLDEFLADRIVEGRMLARTSGLSPLPLMGIPGWWTSSGQDEDFYADSRVFRPPPEGFQPVRVHPMEKTA